MVTANKANGHVHRKALAEQLFAFAMFHKKYTDSYLYLHTQDHHLLGGYNLKVLLQSVGLDESSVIVADQHQLIMGYPEKALAAIYTASDVLLSATYGEGFGVPVIEAQACGTPVVATAVGGLRTAIADGISGVLVDGHDPRAWSSILARLIQEPQRRVLLSMRAIEHASHFGWDATARGTLDIYDRIIGTKASQRKIIG
jgi:glycosyltransferase involved in cell wall biosynthesis